MEDTVQNEEIFKLPIHLYFGTCTDRKQDVLDKRAVEWNMSFEYILNEDFRYLLDSYLERKNSDNRNYFDLIFFIHSELNDIRSPKVTASYYQHNGFKYPKLIFEDGYLRDSKGNKRFFIRDELLAKVGESFSEDAEYHFIEFKRQR